ncbi:hypothetical protein HRW16_30755 [Streptomyces lunaelactis]|nr:hypothetical protein [Streptomyces lunaelactis]NUK05491.1 hypothetical protein [Streptomyces lunaelactis]NUK19880.1 hypothetical protein [Streptomyces lunaelactis]NUK27330.1 hypothetical protein [Streptomyces lunaelactis]NUK38403.1 hypothetical protein [Streptomyces lunaelactis]NUK45456.1 hypothetical protein [Streptomyces lunaelactis]
MRRMNPSETKETTDATETTEATVAKDKATAETVEPTEAARTESAADENAVADEAEAEQDHDDEDAEEAPRASSGIGAAAAAVVAAGLGVVALSGSWVGKVAAERQTLIGQIETSQTGTPAQQISALYGDAWHTTALVNGVFALLALIVGVAVFAWPQKAGWVRAFAVAGVVLGVLGLIVSAGMYFDFFLDLPSAGAGTGS